MLTTRKERSMNTTALPELHVPAALAEDYAKAHAELETLTPVGVPDWTEQLRYRLFPHLRAVIAIREYGGVEPGSMADPRRVQRSMWVPYVSPIGGVSSIVQQPESVSPSRESIEEYQRSEASRPEFEAKVDALAEEILADPARSWNLYVHLRALDSADARGQARAEAEKQERTRIAREECPVCRCSDARRIGPVARRTLLPTQPRFPRAGTIMIRSCEACWLVAVDAHRVALAGEKLEDGALTRSAAVARAIAEATVQ